VTEATANEIKNIAIDDRLGSYKPYYDHGWAQRILEVTANTPLDPIVFDLTVAFRGIVNTHILPWLMVQNLKGFAVGMSKAYEPVALQFVAIVAEKLSGRMSTTLRHMQKKDLEANLQLLFQETMANREKAVTQAGDFDVDGYWEKTLANSEFQLSLWGSQRLCYGGFYYAYEDFLLRVFKLVKADPNYRIQDKFPKDFSDAFGVSLSDYCWSDPKVLAARFIRHALVHAGGRETKDVKSVKHGIKVTDGELQIMAPDTVALFVLLKERALKLVEVVASGFAPPSK
jgi:hypothetical protein